jgi:hypothetical protein
MPEDGIHVLKQVGSVRYVAELVFIWIVHNKTEHRAIIKILSNILLTTKAYSSICYKRACYADIPYRPDPLWGPPNLL